MKRTRITQRRGDAEDAEKTISLLPLRSLRLCVILSLWLFGAAASAQTPSAKGMDELLKHGHVTAKDAYGNWTSERLKNWPEVLNRLAIRPHQHFVPTAGTNSSDIALVIDAMDMFHAEDFDAFAIVSSDSDFTGLASRLRRGGKYVAGSGRRRRQSPSARPAMTSS